MKTITQKSVSESLPAFRSELLEHCRTPRHILRLDKTLAALRKRGKLTEQKLEQRDDKGEPVLTIHYAA